MFSIGVYVTSRYRNYPEFKTTMDEAIKKYVSEGKPGALCTGSSKSNAAGNGLVKRYAFERGIPCRIFETQWANNIPKKPGKKNTAGVRANAMIIRNSNACILFWTPTSISKWDFMSGGCFSFRKMCGKMQRQLIDIKVDIYKPIEQDVDDTELKTLPDREDAAPSNIQNEPAADMSSDTPISSTSSSGASLGGFGGGVPSTAVGSNEPISTDSGEGGESPAETDNISAATPTDSMVVPMEDMPSNATLPELPVDVNGDGVADVSVPAVDVTGDGVPDAQITPLDTNGNGTVDAVQLKSLQTTLPSTPTTSTPPNTQNVANEPSITNATNVETEKKETNQTS